MLTFPGTGRAYTVYSISIVGSYAYLKPNKIAKENPLEVLTFQPYILLTLYKTNEDLNMKFRKVENWETFIYIDNATDDNGDDFIKNKYFIKVIKSGKIDFLMLNKNEMEGFFNNFINKINGNLKIYMTPQAQEEIFN